MNATMNPVMDTTDNALQSVEGVLQRINYRTGEFKMITPGKVWYFKVDRNSKLYFDDKAAILRCFHPLDPVRVLFEPDEDSHQARAVFAWEKVYA